MNDQAHADAQLIFQLILSYLIDEPLDIEEHLKQRQYLLVEWEVHRELDLRHGILHSTDVQRRNFRELVREVALLHKMEDEIYSCVRGIVSTRGRS